MTIRSRADSAPSADPDGRGEQACSTASAQLARSARSARSARPTSASATSPPGPASRPALLGWLVAAIQAARPQQWPKNLLVFAAPLAGATLGRDEGLIYALIAAAAFTAASSAVYYVNDLADAERDRGHPAKRNRPIASGRLPARGALAAAAACAAAALAAGAAIGEPGLIAAVGAYLGLSMLYTLALKHVPVLEMCLVASGFVLRALGGAAATHVPPSGWFLVVCSLGALMVAVSKRYTELAALGADAARHRPVMRWYRAGWLRAGERAIAVAMIAAYLLWAGSGHDHWVRAWHIASALPLAVALLRFDWLAGRAAGRPVEDLIVKDRLMNCAEVAWLALFVAGL